jgi:Zn-dependent protease
VAVLASTRPTPGRHLLLARGPVPIVLTRSGLVPVLVLAAGFALYSAGSSPLLVLGAAVVGGLGGALSLVVHELGHVRAARRLNSVRASRVSLFWLGAATQFEGAYRSGREQLRVALGGPIASLAFAFVLTFATALPGPRLVQYGLFALALLNAAIGLLTLLPVSPLDGHKIVVGVVWCFAGGEERARRIVRRFAHACMAVDFAAGTYVLVEKPLMGAFAGAIAACMYVQKRLVS